MKFEFANMQFFNFVSKKILSPPERKTFNPLKILEYSSINSFISNKMPLITPLCRHSSVVSHRSFRLSALGSQRGSRAVCSFIALNLSLIPGDMGPPRCRSSEVRISYVIHVPISIIRLSSCGLSANAAATSARRSAPTLDLSLYERLKGNLVSLPSTRTSTPHNERRHSSTFPDTEEIIPLLIDGYFCNTTPKSLQYGSKTPDSMILSARNTAYFERVLPISMVITSSI